MNTLPLGAWRAYSKIMAGTALANSMGGTARGAFPAAGRWLCRQQTAWRFGVIHSPQPTRPIAPHFGSERTAISICGYSLCSRNTDGIWAGELWRRGYRVRVTTAPIAAPIANHFVLRFSWRQKLPPIAAVTAASRSRVSAAERACSSFKFAFAAASCA